MTVTLTVGRSFPFAENLITDSNDASNHNNELKQFTICNHGAPPFPGEKVPPVVGVNRLPLVQRIPSVRPVRDGLFIIRHMSKVVNFSPAILQAEKIPPNPKNIVCNLTIYLVG